MNTRRQQSDEARRSLQLVNEMVESTRIQLSENGFIYLFWGVVIMVASFGHFLLLSTDFEWHWIPWLLTIPASIFTTIYYAKKEGSSEINSYGGEIMMWTWIFATAAIFAFGFGLSWYLKEQLISHILPVFGLATVVSGAAIRFKPLIIGGFICGLLAIPALFIEYQYQLLIMGGAALIANTIPGLMLRAKFKSNHGAISGA